MADKSMPNRAANLEKAEGDRWRSEQNAVPASGSDSGARCNDDGDSAGGITNRSLDEEIENQQALLERGRSHDDERSRDNRDVER